MFFSNETNAKRSRTKQGHKGGTRLGEDKKSKEPIDAYTVKEDQSLASAVIETTNKDKEDAKGVEQSKIPHNETKDILSDESDSDVLVIDMGKKTNIKTLN